ncbi:MAG: cysteine protease StiP family protein [Clostridia bacterium]|nr:cysteine protease StiP family protein [Clostridia bacterium]
MTSSFRPEDVTLLLKDLTGAIAPVPTREREKRIQSGTHYSEMLPLEYRPSEEYIRIYEESLRLSGQSTADAVARVAEKIVRKKGKDVVIVSLARAGTPLGVLVRRYLRRKYGISCPHYSISIIRDRGIDGNAVRYLLNRHEAGTLQFLDGWTGKGVIFRELRKAISSFEGIPDDLAVVADPAGLTELCGTHEDLMIASSCLNCTVCGLISRTVLREDLIGEHDFHGAVCYPELAGEDRTYEFIDGIEKLFRDVPETAEPGLPAVSGMHTVHRIAERYGIENLNYIKPGIGETTRVLLRRVPWKLLIDPGHASDPELKHVKQLAGEKGVETEYTTLGNYKCCGLIRQLPDI